MTPEFGSPADIHYRNSYKVLDGPDSRGTRGWQIPPQTYEWNIGSMNLDHSITLDEKVLLDQAVAYNGSRV